MVLGVPSRRLMRENINESNENIRVCNFIDRNLWCWRPEELRQMQLKRSLY